MPFTTEQYREYAKNSEAVKRYRNSEKAKACRDRYRQSEKGKAAEIQARKTRKEKFRSIVVAAKSAPCADCGRSFDPTCMDFHHISGTKEMTIGWGKYTPTKLRAEIEKCVVLCACCHRLRHKGK